MTLKKSSVNPFRFTFLNTLSKSFWIPLAMMLFNAYMILADIVGRIDLLYELLINDPKGAQRNLQNLVFELSTSGGGLGTYYLWSSLLIIGSVLTAAVIFKFMMNKSAVNVWYSLGMTRGKLFFSKYLAGAFMLSMSVIIPLAVSVGLNIWLLGSCKELWLSALYLAILFLSRILIYYTVAVCTFCALGTTFEGIFFSLVYCVMPVVAEMFVESAISEFLFGAPNSTESWTLSVDALILGEGSYSFHINKLGLIDFIMFLSSSEYQNAAMLTSDEPFSLNLTTLIIAVVILAALILVAYIVHNKRKNEIAGFLGVNPFATGVVVFTSSMFAVTVYLWIASGSVDRKILSCVIFSIIAFTIIYLIADAISLRSFRLLVKRLWKLPVHLAAFCSIILVFATGLFGYTSRTPDLANIKSVAISTNTADTFVEYRTNVETNDSAYFFGDDVINRFLSIGNLDMSIAGGFTDSSDICEISEIHKMLIKCKSLEVTSESLCAPYDERVLPVNIGIIYQLKDGRTFERVYHVATEEILKRLADLTLTEHYKSLAVDTLKNGGVNYYGVGAEFIVGEEELVLYSPNMTNVVLASALETEDADALRREVAKDVENGSLPLNFRSNADILGYVKVINSGSLMFVNEELGTTYIYDPEYGLVDGDSVEDLSDAPYLTLNDNMNEMLAAGSGLLIPVYSDMKNTVAFLEEYDLMKHMKDTAQPVEARLWKVDEAIKYDPVWMYNRYTSLTSGYWSKGVEYKDSWQGIGDEENTVNLPSLPETAITVTDPEKIQMLLDKVQMLALTCYDGEYVQFIYEDGSMTFGYIPA